MEKSVKVLVFYSEIEARLLSGLLTEKNIGHMIRSYHDSAYDGLWQTQNGWGDLIADEKDTEEILSIYREMSDNINKE